MWDIMLWLKVRVPGDSTPAEYVKQYHGDTATRVMPSCVLHRGMMIPRGQWRLLERTAATVVVGGVEGDSLDVRAGLVWISSMDDDQSRDPPIMENDLESFPERNVLTLPETCPGHPDSLTALSWQGLKSATDKTFGLRELTGRDNDDSLEMRLRIAILPTGITMK